MDQVAFSFLYLQEVKELLLYSHDTLPDCQCEKTWSFIMWTAFAHAECYRDKTTRVIVIAILKTVYDNHTDIIEI